MDEKYRLEVHVHTKYSHDSLLPFWLLYLLCRVRGITHIAITEHNNIKGGIAFRNYCKVKGSKLHVIVGEEVMTTQGEIIGLFISKEIKAGLTPEKTIDEIISQNGIVYIPHPYDLKRCRTVLAEQAIAKNVNKIHCVESHNGRNISPTYDDMQKFIANKYGLTKVIGSDAHTCFEVGRNYMEVTIPPESAKAFLQAIGNPIFHKKEYLKFAHTITKFVRIVRFIQRGDIHGLYRAINKKLR